MGIKISSLLSEKLEFECEVVTPMFIGGADKSKAELRSSSIKGLLRFWWRVVYGYMFDSIESMKAKESEIFGSNEKSSSFKVIIYEISKKPVKEILPGGKGYKVYSNSKNKEFFLKIIDYLAYGSLLEHVKETKRNEYIKEYYPVGTTFKISFIFKNLKFKNDILVAFKMLYFYGGIGAKSRNGFGCFRIIKDEKVLSKVEFKTKTYENIDIKNFLIFSKMTKNFKIDREYDKWEDALSDIGIVYRESRLSLENRHVFDKRAKIGLPIIAKGEKVPEEFKNNRLAKPLFIHVSKSKSKDKDKYFYKSSILLLPYYFDSCYNFWNNLIKELEKNIKKV